MLNWIIDLCIYTLACYLSCDSIKYTTVPAAESVNCVLLKFILSKYDSEERTSKNKSPDFAYLEECNTTVPHAVYPLTSALPGSGHIHTYVFMDFNIH